MGIEVMGRAHSVIGSGTHPLPRGHMGTVFEILLLRPNHSISVTAIADMVWPGSNLTAATARRRVQVIVSRLRRFLIARFAADAIAIVNDSDAYRLNVDRLTLDRVAFEEDAAAAIDGNYQAGVQALALWQGEPYVGFSWSSELQAQRRQLISLRRRVEAAMRPDGTHPRNISTVTAKPRVDDPTIIQRQRLLNRMPKVGERRVGLLSAPAGYGKSVVLA
ncbi:MAG: hypothetical protein GEU79_07705, partial [Acidimicrobiia bacterium]|nr:hypothetical protein [Acidimicrobiia bacterium]